MKWIFPLLSLLFISSPMASGNEALTKEIRMIRRAFLDVLELIPSPEEVDWYVVYNSNGYSLAVEYLTKGATVNGWDRNKLWDKAYMEQPDRLIEAAILDKNIVYLSGLWKGEMSPEIYDAGVDKFVKDALLATDDNASNAIDYMINELTCRPSTAEESNEMTQVFSKVSVKSDELSALKTVLLHILQMHDCKYK